MVSTYKKSDKLVTIRYEANNSYFDILLDSVENIIYNFDINEQKYLINNSSELIFFSLAIFSISNVNA